MDKTPIKKPLRPSKSPHNKIDQLTQKELLEKQHELSKKELQLDKDIGDLLAQGVHADLTAEMQALHAYNETKDITQIVLGYLNDSEQSTLNDLHVKYNLPAE